MIKINDSFKNQIIEIFILTFCLKYDNLLSHFYYSSSLYEKSLNFPLSYGYES